MSLSGFLLAHREEVLRSATQIVADVGLRSSALDDVRKQNLPVFLEAVIAGLRRRTVLPADPVPQPQRTGPARPERNREHYEVDEIVHEYSALCTAILKSADRAHRRISSREYQALYQAVDENIAADVVAHDHARRHQTRQHSAERLGFVAHELRNALQTAALSFQAIRNGRAGAQGVTGGVVERSHYRLRELVESLLAQVRLGSRPAIRREPLALLPLAQEAVAFVGAEAREKGVHLELAADASLVADADPMLLTSALTNLLQNAVKFTPVGGTVKVRALRLDAHHVRIEVEDECGGIDPVLRDAIFAPFVQGVQNRRGLGLGLSIAREIVAAHDGTLTFRDLPGRGCVFAIDLPAEEEPTASTST